MGTKERSGIMATTLHGRLGLAAACVLALAPAARTQEDRAAALDRPALEQAINRVLRDVINTGADLFNPPVGDHAGCYRLYQGALMTVKPILDHRPDLQKAITTGLADAQRERSISERAFILRRVIDRIRAEVGRASLWDSLGGLAGVKKVVDDFVEMAAADPRVDFSRGGKYAFGEEQMADLKKKLVEMISQVSGGPLRYTGKGMKEVHKGMGITEAQFSALAGHLKTALDKNGAKPADRDAILKAVGGTRPDIVEKKGNGK
jgi:hemoglobin